MTAQKTLERTEGAQLEKADLWSRFQEQFDQMVQDFFPEKAFSPSWMMGKRPAGFFPQMDVAETEKQLRITLDLPGMEEKDISVNLSRDILTIRGEKRTEEEEEVDTWHRTERSYGSFVRSVRIPFEADVEKVKAKFRRGVLTISIPKSEKAIASTWKVPILAE